MHISGPDDVLDLMDFSFTSAALTAALELGLFWMLEEKPIPAERVADGLGIPSGRCRYWLQLLVEADILELNGEKYSLTPSTRGAVLDTYSRDTWGYLAKEARERFSGLRDLSIHIRNPGSAWTPLGLIPSDYVSQMSEGPEQARRFTRMLFELHRPFADEVARFLDPRGEERVMDLGGGSGVVSLALLRRHPRLTAVVVDIPSVCEAGREIAAEESLGERITYQPADFLHEELPTGFDMVMECDVDVYDEDLFRKIRRTLNPGGRFVVVDQLAPGKGIAPPSRTHWAFQASMIDPSFSFPTLSDVLTLMEKAGFTHLSHAPLPRPSRGASRFTRAMMVIEAVK